jgi:hypothetical protein
MANNTLVIAGSLSQLAYRDMQHGAARSRARRRRASATRLTPEERIVAAPVGRFEFRRVTWGRVGAAQRLANALRGINSAAFLKALRLMARVIRRLRRRRERRNERSRGAEK